jgi:hypothetical protein
VAHYSFKSFDTIICACMAKCTHMCMLTCVCQEKILNLTISTFLFIILETILWPGQSRKGKNTVPKTTTQRGQSSSTGLSAEAEQALIDKIARSVVDKLIKGGPTTEHEGEENFNPNESRGPLFNVIQGVHWPIRYYWQCRVGHNLKLQALLIFIDIVLKQK